MSNMKTIIALVGDKDRIVFYCKDGTTHPLPSNEKFTEDLVAKVTEALAQGQEITLDLQDQRLDFYRKVEEKSKGLLRFYKVAKAALLGGSASKQTTQFLDTIKIPVAIRASEVAEGETVVALVQENENSEPVMIQDAHLLERQVAFAARDGEEITGLKAFMIRMATVQAQRKHSADDLLHFLQANDLPLTESGQIIAYKRLQSCGEHYTDSHTKKVKQRIGSRVFMSPSLVNPDRNQECSNGLHVGRRDYMGKFSGDKIILVLVNPEDVIAVPRDYQRSKMRCCGYHIVAEVGKTAFANLENNKSMTANDYEAKLLRQIIKGQHVEITNTVEITKDCGEGLVFRELVDDRPQEVSSDTKPVRSIEQAEVEVAKELVDPTVNNPKAIKERLKKATKANPPAEAPVPEMTADQQWAKDNWHKVTDGTLTKIALAKMCNTSTRSLDRWKEKYNF